MKIHFAQFYCAINTRGYSHGTDEGILGFQHHKISACMMLLQIDEIGIGILRIRIQLILEQNPKNQFAQGRSIGVIGRPQTQTGMAGMGLDLLDTAQDDKQSVGERNDERLV